MRRRDCPQRRSSCPPPPSPLKFAARDRLVVASCRAKSGERRAARAGPCLALGSAAQRNGLSSSLWRDLGHAKPGRRREGRRREATGQTARGDGAESVGWRCRSLALRRRREMRRHGLGFRVFKSIPGGATQRLRPRPRHAPADGAG